jgi:ABC-type glycerol-3-phosphate transport system permease component
MSTVVALVATTVSVFVCALAGYGFAKFRFAGRRLRPFLGALAVVPAVALFVVLRKQLLEGPSTGAVKG